MKRVLTAIPVALALLASPASAAELRLAVKPANGVQMGAEQEFSGRLTDNGVPVSGQVVTLEARRYPYAGGFEPIKSVLTDDQGQFFFYEAFDRNHEVRVSTSNATSAVRAAWIYPRFKLSFKALKRGRVRLKQRYWAPRDARLSERTHFYLGPRKAKAGRLRARVKTRKVGARRYVATAVVKVPRSYRGRFRYASCLPGDQKAGMGDPRKRCPRKFRF